MLSHRGSLSQVGVRMTYLKNTHTVYTIYIYTIYKNVMADLQQNPQEDMNVTQNSEVFEPNHRVYSYGAV